MLSGVNVHGLALVLLITVPGTSHVNVPATVTLFEFLNVPPKVEVDNNAPNVTGVEVTALSTTGVSLPVAGKVAATAPEFARFVVGDAPATLKKLIPTPVKVYSEAAVIVMNAV